jgi:subtilisin
MRRWLTALTVTAALAATAMPVLPASAARSEATAQPYVVVLREGRDSDRVAGAHARRYGAEVSFVYRAAVSGYAATLSASQLSALRADPDVAFVSEDRPVAATDTVPTGVDRIEAEPATGAPAAPGSLAVAVIDTGSGPHAELNVAGGHNCSTGPSYNDGNGHGTHVAGTIGAKNDGSGVVGVLPGVRIYSVRVLNNAGSGSWSSIICGVDWVTANAASTGIRVANMSLGGRGSDDGEAGKTCATTTDALRKAICNSVAAGITYVVAAGNDNADLAGSVPAAYDEVLTVTAAADFNGRPGGGAAATCRSDVDDTAADFSNWTTVASGDDDHVIAGPGVCIASTWKGAGYKTISGTSMASPHVTGTVARCLAAGDCVGGPGQIAQRLLDDAAAHAKDAAAYGFLGDPDQPIVIANPKSGDVTRLYGYLAYAGGY